MVRSELDSPGDGSAGDVGGPVAAHQLRQLLDAVLVISSELDLETVLQRIVEAATTLVGARYGALGVLDVDGEALSDFITVGLDDDQRAAIGDLPLGRGVLGRLILDPRPVRLPDIATAPDSVGFPPGHPTMTSFLGTPVLIRGRAFGNLYLCDKIGAREFAEADEELVVALASAASVAIDNARLHARVADITLIEDRDRIARDLHDTVIQRLFAIGLSLEGAARMTHDERAAIRMQSAVDDLDITIREIRTSIFELHSGHGAGTSLQQGVLDLASEASRSLGFDPSMRFDGPIDTVVPEVVATHLLAVTREALANVARHANASTVEVHLEVDADDVHLRVLDDGIGPPETVDHSSHGLSNMATRAAQSGGTCTLSSRPDGGALLHWTAPLR